MAEYDYGKKLLEAVKNKEITVEDAKRLFAMELNPTLEEISKTYDVKGGPGRLEKKRAEDKKIKRSQMNLDQLRAFDEEEAKRDTREEEFLKALIENELGADRHGILSGNRAKFGSGFLDTIRASADPKKRDVLYQNPKFANLINQYMGLKEPLSAVQGQGQAAQTGDQGQGDPIIKDGLPTTGEMLEQGTVSAGGNTAIPPNFDQMTPEEKINILAQLMQQEDPLSAVREQAETLKDTYKTGLEDVSSILQGSVTEYEKEAKNRNNKIDDIFADIEKRIPMQAKYASMTAPASSAAGQGSQFFARKYIRKEMEQNLFQQNNANKIEYEKLRKQEIEARRKQDLDALYDIKLKQAEILSGIDKSMLDAEAALMQAQIENDLAMELEQLKVELGTTGKTYGAQATISQRDKSPDVPIEEGMQFAIQKYGPVAATENYYVLQGTKNIQGKQMSFPEFYNAYIGKQYVPKDSKKTKKHTVKTVVALWLGV